MQNKRFRFVPEPVKRFRRNVLNWADARQYRRLDTAQRFSKIYAENVWGDGQDGLFSGPGSHDKRITAPYVDAIKSFVEREGLGKSANDIGCGDFNIGRQLKPLFNSYRGFDIVKSVVEANRERFPDTEFDVLDATSEIPPYAEVVFVREVMQHLSNADIARMLNKLQGTYDVLIVANSRARPSADYLPNKDIETGHFARRPRMHSGVDLEAEPFNATFARCEVLSEVPFRGSDFIIETKAYFAA